MKNNRIIMTAKQDHGKNVSLVLGDITEEQVDAIVNAANSQLIHGGGVAGAIVRKGGYIIQEESYQQAPVNVGKAAITSGGKLPASHVIHAVGPRWGEGNEEEKLANAVFSSLELASRYSLESISLPAISTGIFGFPLNQASHIILGEIKNYLKKNSNSSLKEIRLCIFDQNTFEAFSEAWKEIFPG